MSLPRRVFELAPAERRVDRRAVLVAAGVLVLAVALVWPPVVVLVLVGGSLRWVRRRVARRRDVRDRRRHVERELPGAVSLLQLALAAGHVPRSAVGVVAEFGRGVVASRFGEVGRRLDAGAGFADAIDSCVEQDDLIGRPLRILEQAERHGQNLDLQLAALADEFGRRRLADIDVRSQRLGVQMLFPLVLCVLPAFVLLTMLPLVSGLLDGLRP